MKRESGILLSISSLPSRYGIGCFSKEAHEFVDQLNQAGQSCWQILPLGPTSYGDSPYQSFSTFAGNPYFISLEDLIEEGVLTRKECDSADFGTHPGAVDYAKIYKERFPLLRLAYERSNISQDEEFKQFSADNKWWLEDYALFMAVKSRFDGKPWTQWAEDIRLRWQNALDYYRRELYYDIEFHEYLQFKFIRQWNKLKSYANHNGIRIVGDTPIYVAMDSADAWAHPELFELDRDNVPTAVAGCPPDGFSSTGQLWGNPLYRWGYHRQTGYQWWISRLSYCYRLYDAVKAEEIDILINNAGFGAYGATWDVPLETELNMLDLNVRAVQILTKLFLADFRKRGSGRILNVASSAGFLAGPLMSGYYATKGYVLRLSEAISEELRQEGSRVTVTALCPGHVETNFDARAKVRRSIGGVSAKRVAQAGIEGMLRGKVVVLPGALMKMTYVGEKLLPESWMLKIAYRAQARKG